MGDDAPQRIDPAALTCDDAARLLSRASGLQVTADDIRADVEAGAPTNDDGSIHLVHYGAWLVRAASPIGAGRGD